MIRDQSNSWEKIQYFLMVFENMPKFTEISGTESEKLMEISRALFNTKNDKTSIEMYDNG